VYLTVSRGGLVLVGVFLLAQAAFLMRTGTLRPRQLGVFLCAGWAVVVCTIVLGLVLLSRFDIPEIYAVQRFRLEGKPVEDKREVLTRDALEAVLRGPWYGHGLFSFTGPAEGADIRSAISPSQGSHNMYLTIWGETGIVGLVTYLVVLGLGLHRTFTASLSGRDRQALVLMWLIFLLVGFIWHNVLENPFGVLYTALIYYLPNLLAYDYEPYPVSQAEPIGALHA
jgi:O-antigen ligase